MPYADSERAKAASNKRKQAWRARTHDEKYGIGAGDQRGKQGTQPRGPNHPRWNDGRARTTQGYIRVQVGVGHALADQNGYAYEHALVWSQANGPIPTDRVVHHVNGDRADNRVENLRLVTHAEHAREHGARVLTDDEVRAVRERYAAGEDGTALAVVYGVPMQRVYRILRGETRRDAGGPMHAGSLRGNANRKLAGRIVDGVTHDGYPDVIRRLRGKG